MGSHGWDSLECECLSCENRKSWLKEIAKENREEFQKRNPAQQEQCMREIERRKGLDEYKKSTKGCKNSKLARLDRGEAKIQRNPETGEYEVKALKPTNYNKCSCSLCQERKEEMKTALGKITFSELRMEEAILEWHVTISLWEHGCSDHRESITFLEAGMIAAKVRDFNQMLGQLIIAEIEGGMTKNWRILREVK